MSAVRFKEIQRFNQAWLWAIVFFTGVPVYYLFIHQILFTNKVWIISANWIIIFMFALHLIITILLIVTKLHVELSSRYIIYQFFPFHFKKKKVPFSQIHSAYVRKFSPIKEMSAMGVKIKHSSKAYNIKGYWGLQLEYTGGRQLLLGTQKPEELNLVLKELGLPEE